jgi:DNA-binding phage protein
MLREDGTLITPENLTDEDIEIEPWNVLEFLLNDDKIKAFLEAALEEAPGDMPFYSRCLVKAAQARTINQLAKETGADRKVLCGMFLEHD